jgi:hypothetical protein
VARFFGRTLEFNPKTQTTPDRAAWEGGLKTLAAMRGAGRRHNPSFVVLTDDSFDCLGACVDACGGGLMEHGPTETAYPKWRKLIRLSDPTKVEALDGIDLTRATVIVAPTSGFEALTHAEWKTLIQRLRAGMKT